VSRSHGEQWHILSYLARSAGTTGAGWSTCSYSKADLVEVAEVIDRRGGVH
jgi:hypothetical protein